MSGTHDDVIKWKHFPSYWPFVRGIHRSPVNSPHKGQWRGALIFSLICAWINSWVNNGETGDFRRHRAHYDVIVMIRLLPTISDKPVHDLRKKTVWNPLRLKMMTLSLTFSAKAVNDLREVRFEVLSDDECTNVAAWGFLHNPATFMCAGYLSGTISSCSVSTYIEETRTAPQTFRLTLWCRVMHICVSKLTGIGSDNGLLPGRRQAIGWTNVGILLIRPELSEIHASSFRTMHFKCRLENGGHFVSASVC